MSEPRRAVSAVVSTARMSMSKIRALHVLDLRRLAYYLDNVHTGSLVRRRRDIEGE